MAIITKVAGIISDVVDKIRKVKTGTKAPFENVPVDPVVILDVQRL